MIYERQKAELKKYRHVIAALIAQSEGYFTPPYALQAVKAHKQNKSFGCEWYFHIVGIRFENQSPQEKYSDENFIKINREIVSRAIKNRHRKYFKRCLAIVDRDIAGDESVGASWF